MPYVKVKQKCQITIPAAVRREVGISEGDTLEARAENGKIILEPQTIQPREKVAIDFHSMLGIAKEHRSFETAEEINEYVRHLRSE